MENLGFCQQIKGPMPCRGHEPGESDASTLQPTLMLCICLFIHRLPHLRELEIVEDIIPVVVQDP